MNELASKWNARYASHTAPLPAPAEVLTCGARWLPNPAVGRGCSLTAGSLPVLSRESASCASNQREDLRALDLACGRAGNGQWLAERGYRVSAWDISDTVIAEIRRRQPPLIDDAVVRDVSTCPPEMASFDVIVVCRFLDRAICTAVSKALKPGGILFYQTFLHGLANPDFLLRPNELLQLFGDLHVLEYREQAPDEYGKAEALLVARQDKVVCQ